MTAPLPKYRHRRLTDVQIRALAILLLGGPAIWSGVKAAQAYDQLILEPAPSRIIVVTETVAAVPTTSMTATTAAGERARVASPVRSSAVVSRPRTTPPAAPIITAPATTEVTRVPSTRASTTPMPTSDTSTPPSSPVHGPGDSHLGQPSGSGVSGMPNTLGGTVPPGGTQ